MFDLKKEYLDFIREIDSMVKKDKPYKYTEEMYYENIKGKSSITLSKLKSKVGCPVKVVSHIHNTYNITTNSMGIIHGGCFGVERIELRSHTTSGKKLQERHLISTLIHEMSHGLMHISHRNYDSKNKEIEAETVSFLVGKYLGIENHHSKIYIKRCLMETPYEKVISTSNVVKTVNYIVEKLEKGGSIIDAPY